MKRAGLFLHHPECSLHSCDGVIKTILSEYKVEIFTQANCNTKNLKDKDLIVFPGGIGDSDSYDKIFDVESVEAVRNYVKTGGKYLGICMGGYWAGKHYFNLLQNADTVQYIKRKESGIRRSFGTVIPVLWEGVEADMFFYDGCAVVGDKKKFKTIATYSNGDPMAVIQGNVGVIGCHPESVKYWYKPRRLKTFWHKEQHHKLLSNFIAELTKT
jgi:glutamine amidotransferase-like uncharacterized protein